MAAQPMNIGTDVDVNIGGKGEGAAVRRRRVHLAEVPRNLFGKAAAEPRRANGGAGRGVPVRGVPVRNFANDDIYFHVKRMDNSRVVRQADPKTGGVCWRMIGSAAAAALLLIGVLLPSAYGLLAGYQIQALKEESKRLATEQASLELEEAKLLSPERMEQLAREQQFVDPDPQKVIYLDATHGAAVAMNQSGLTQAASSSDQATTNPSGARIKK